MHWCCTFYVCLHILSSKFCPFDKVIGSLYAADVDCFQYGSVELFVRLVNHRDAAAQSTSRVNPANMQRYREQPQVTQSP